MQLQHKTPGTQSQILLPHQAYPVAPLARDAGGAGLALYSERQTALIYSNDVKCTL